MKEAQGNILDIQLPCTLSEMVTTGKSENLKYILLLRLSRRTRALVRFSENVNKSIKLMDKL